MSMVDNFEAEAEAIFDSQATQAGQPGTVLPFCPHQYNSEIWDTDSLKERVSQQMQPEPLKPKHHQIPLCANPAALITALQQATANGQTPEEAIEAVKAALQMQQQVQAAPAAPAPTPEQKALPSLMSS